MLCLCCFLLLSYAVLPVKWSHRHYLNVAFTIGICCMQVGAQVILDRSQLTSQIAFIIPLGTEPTKCHNEITPNNMYSDMSCAWTGALLLFGGWVVVVWSMCPVRIIDNTDRLGLIRTVAFHLQVCWEMMLGRKFMWGAIACGLGIPILGETVMLVYTGVSYRFGEMCHINIDHSQQDYWIPLLALSAAALVLQLTTVTYCVYVYVKSIFDTNTSTTNSSGLPSYSASVRPVTARQAYKRIRRVLQLQWRAVALALVIIGHVILFAVVFVSLNESVKQTPENFKKAEKWLVCLGATSGDKEFCRKFAGEIGPNAATLLATLILLSLVGLWNFLLFARPSTFIGWYDFIKSKAVRRHEFVSADARNRYEDARAYEMLNSSMKTPEPVIKSPSPSRMLGATSPDGYLGRDARYVTPTMSFSAPKRPRPPTSPQGREWNPEATFARGHY